MNCNPASARPIHLPARAWAIGLALFFSCAGARAAPAATTGKIQGKIVAADTGEPVGFVDVALVPADTTMRPVGGLTNSDGTFLLEAAPGRYVLKIRALSYAHKRVEGILIEQGKLLPFSTSLASEAIQQEEVVVEAKARQNTESSMLSARRRSRSVGDAVSAEQVRKSPDKDAAEVLRRVTGLSVSGGKYVFVRGLGERYSSTEIDGVRIASPEQNKRVVPLDLIPANLLENIVVQKTYTADRPGEFGGGDVQVHTKDFPGARAWSFSTSQGGVDGVTFHDRRTYPGSRSDLLGFGSNSRKIPDAVRDLGGDRKLEEGAFDGKTLAAIARSFRNVWSSRSATTIPNASYSASYGDEFKLFGRSLGLIESWSLSRGFDRKDESQRLFRSASGDTLYNYDVQRSTESVQLGGISGLSYRISPRHSLHLRGLYTNSADDEVRVYEGSDHTRDEAITGTHLNHRGTRLMYVERNVLSGTLEGQHEFARLLGADVGWKFTRSKARRQQPDRREVTYDRRYYFEGDTAHWVVGSQGSREYGDLRDNGWGTTVRVAVPYRLGGLGSGNVAVGYDRQTKRRDNFYRRFDILHTHDANLWESPPDTLFAPDTFDSTQGGGSIVEKTFNDSRFTDNYRASQRLNAGYVNVDVPFGRRVRGSFGVRVEGGLQDVESFDLFNPSTILQAGKLENTDWLPTANVTWSLSELINLRIAASRTLSRPDLNELSPSPSLEYQAGSLVLGNPLLQRALIDNYDVRLEAFPSVSEVFAAGFFYKRLRQPIEQVIQGAADPLVYPRNSDGGRNLGVELEARSGLGRVWKRLNRFSLNTNASIISSEVRLKLLSQNGSERHPLQGQANYLVNAGLSYSSENGRKEFSVLMSTAGKRLAALGYAPLPDIYEQPITTLDTSMGFAPFTWARVKFSARNLLNQRVRQLQGGREVSGFQTRRSFSLALAFGS